MAFSKKNKSGLTSLLFFICCMVVFTQCGDEKPPKQKTKKITNPATEKQANKKESTNISVKTFQLESGWGYDIIKNGKTYIHQTSKPAIGGNKGFDHELEARKVGELMITKIEKGIIPPSVTKTEVDSLILKY